MNNIDIKSKALLYSTYHDCYVTVIDTDEDIANSPHNSVLCKFEDGRTQSIPITYLKGEYRYYRWRNTVIELKVPHNYKDVVHKMRGKVNQDSLHPINMMIEDINECTKEEYNQIKK